jgi:hypothetical protein
MDQEECAQHVHREQQGEHAGEHAEDQRDAAGQVQAGHHRGGNVGGGDAHLRKRGLGTRDGELAELLPAVGGEEEAGDKAQDGAGRGGEGGLVGAWRR